MSLHNCWNFIGYWGKTERKDRQVGKTNFITAIESKQKKSLEATQTKSIHCLVKKNCYVLFSMLFNYFFGAGETDQSCKENFLKFCESFCNVKPQITL